VTRAAALVLLGLAAASPASGQDLKGYVSALFGAMPEAGANPGDRGVAELRTRLFAEGLFDAGDHVHFTIGAYVDGLVANREPLGARGVTRDAIARAGDLYADVRMSRFDLRLGMSRIVWGRLDEFQPGDVVNPLDLSRFLLEGRSEARLPVAMVRGRAFLSGDTTVEGVLVPFFRRGRFDQVAEETSPFALTPPGRPERHEPDVTWRSLQGGGRLTSTVGRLDWGVSVYRGFESFPAYTYRVPDAGDSLAIPLVVPTVVETFPRFTMLATDFETVRGPWGLRGEIAWFPDDTLQSFSPVTPVPGRSVEAGIGMDRRAGNYRVSGNVLVARRRVDRAVLDANPIPFDARIENTDVRLVGWAERTFARETRTVRMLAVYNPDAASAFVRGIVAFSLRDNLLLETSAGWLRGTELDLLSRLSTRDFVYARLKVYF
jgi:hypothetical protein